MLQDFQKFLFRGNLIDLAVAVVVGTAFSAVVTALVKDLITPLIAALVGSPHFSGLSFTLHRSVFDYGDFLNALVTFVLVAAAVFYMVVLPMNLVQARAARGRAPQAPATKACPECCSQIPVAAKRCAFCTSVQP